MFLLRNEDFSKLVIIKAHICNTVRNYSGSVKVYWRYPSKIDDPNSPT